ncbi:signal transduction histidine kinase [Actinokineospora auranticolor]|uniref:histidine kinase n=1 Tax=Actinokineospora auranticolor TaxID=155976 RepID=A0A2S6H1D9_9PSEU|nr:signal transduction histidine kinase [Actinokineospora auranticolor]
MTSAVYGIVLVAGLYWVFAGLGPNDPLRTIGFGAGVAALFALEWFAARHEHAAAFLAARLALFVAVALLDGSGLSRALFVLLPFLAYLGFGRAAGSALGAVCLGLLVGGFAVWVPEWYRQAAVVSDLLMFGLGLVLAVAMAEVVLRERRSAARVGELSAAVERNRLARDIHDSLGHHLTAISVQLEKAEAFRAHDPSVADRALTDARRSARLALEDVRASVGALRAPVSLVAALGDLVDGEKVTLRVVGTERPIGQAAVTTLYRAAQEALTNAHRHSAADEVRVSVEYTADEVRLTVRDNGRGFVVAEQVDGFGLVGLRERAALVGGVVAVESAPGAGTTVRLAVGA